MPATRFQIAVAFLLVSCALTARAGEDSPYEAYVAVEGAEVVAGPGHRFYATDLLARGTKVEIYREEASGWLAIRPPEGSFSWVPAEFVERSEEDSSTGRVKETTGAWIGTSVEHVSEHRQHVTLKVGELVDILDQKTVSGKSGQKTWLKIAPPAGEFRWIHLRDVSRQKPEIIERHEEPVIEEEGESKDQAIIDHADQRRPLLRSGARSVPDSARLSQRERDQEEEPRRVEVAGGSIVLRDLDTPGTRYDAHVQPAQYRSTTGSATPKSTSPDGFIARKRHGSEQIQSTVSETARSFPPSQPRERLTIATNTRPEPIERAPAVTQPVGGADADTISRQLEQIETDLSMMVAQDKTLWNLAGLRERTDRLVESGADPASRGRARLVLDKIKQFEGTFDVADYGPITTANSGTAGSGNRTTTNGKSVSTPLADPRYDAQGWLKPVISRKNEKPPAPYAVVDKDGQPLCFITPAPGLNLQRYLNKQVGVYGRRGFLEELKKAHVTAERVIELDKAWR
jgi:hypothetical protein